MEIKSNGIWQAFASHAFAWTATVVCLFYRKGWYLTPDDTESPFGKYEPAMVRRYEKWGKYWADYWWLGMRNRGYGFAYDLKPDHFKNLTTYADCEVAHYPGRFMRKIVVDGYVERTFFFGFFHIILGWRLRPIYDEWVRLWRDGIPTPYRPINMDARPIFSIRAGGKDD